MPEVQSGSTLCLYTSRWPVRSITRKLLISLFSFFKYYSLCYAYAYIIENALQYQKLNAENT